MSNLSADAEGIRQKLAIEGINSLYHFTSVHNLSGVGLHGGLCSKELLESRGSWPVATPGGNALSHLLDQQKGNWGLISLNFTPHTPLAYNTKFASHLCFFEVSPNVALRSGVVFTNSNAAKSSQTRGNGLAGLNSVRFDMIRSSPMPWEPDWINYSQAEVLVPEFISLAEIRRVCFVSLPSLELAERLCGTRPHPRFEIDKEPFANYPNAARRADFTHVEGLSLTTAEIDKSNAWNTPQSVTLLSKRSHTQMTAVAEVWALAGTSGKMSWSPSGSLEETEFESSNNYRWWESIPSGTLSPGRHSVEIRLNGVLWSLKEFEVVE